MNNKRTFELGTIAGTKIMKGIPSFKSKNENLQETEKLKILRYSNIKNFITTGNTDDVDFSNLDLSRRYKDCEVHKGDIAVPLIARSDKGSVLYIEKEPLQKCIYHETMLVVRISNENINNRYIALVLDNLCQEWFKIPTTGTLPFRITVSHLAKSIIPLPNKEVQDEIANNYTKAIQQIEEVENKIQRLLGEEADV